MGVAAGAGRCVVAAAVGAGVGRGGGSVSEPTVKSTWLRFDDVECVRCRRWAGPEGETCWVVTGGGMVCDECVTPSEEARAQRA